MFDRECRNFGTPIPVSDPVWIGGRVNIMGAGMIEVWPDIMPEQVRPRLPLQGIPKQIDRAAVKNRVSLDHRERRAPGQNRVVDPTWTMRLGDIAGIAQVVV